jgi:hypothetical protein
MYVAEEMWQDVPISAIVVQLTWVQPTGHFAEGNPCLVL